MWFEFLHHISLHFPIVMTMGLAGIGLWSWRHDINELQQVIRWGGWFAFIATTVAMVSGILAAPGWFGGDGSMELRHHRDLAITTWCVVGLATVTYDYGVRHTITDLRRFGITMWCVAVFGVIGTGHWGGSQKHPESVPWHDSEATQVYESGY